MSDSSSEESDSEDNKKKGKKNNSKIKSEGKKQKKTDPSTTTDVPIRVAPKRKLALTEEEQEPTMEEINEYKLKQIRWDDPMRTMDK